MSTALSFAPVSASEGTAIQLAMQRLWLGGRILPAGAHLTVQHVFQSAEDKPLEIIYSFPLPRDAALRAFRMTGEGFEAFSELKATEDAVKAYEQGIADGSVATLARNYGDGVVNLTVGNIRPRETITVYLELLAGVELRDDGFRFRFPFTLAPAYHRKMRVAVTKEGEGEIELPASEFGDVILPPFRKDAGELHEVGFELSVFHQMEITEIGSPSHSIRVRQDGTGPARVALAAERDVPDRDLVLDIALKRAEPQVLCGKSAEGKRTFCGIIPSTAFGEKPVTPRRTAIVLDRSGSMSGSPMKQARRAVEACLAALGEEDSFGLVAFDDRVETLGGELLTGTRKNRDKAREFLNRVDARGGTELAKGFLAAAEILRGGGDVLIVTDGQVAGTEEILAQARAANIRLFCLGIGSASQDRFLALLARETGGISRFVTPRERVDIAAVDLFASIGRPVASGLKVTPGAEPEPPTVVFAGSPVLLFGETADELRQIELSWDGGRLSVPLPEESAEMGTSLWLLQGSRLITDWESRYPNDEPQVPHAMRDRTRVQARLLALSQKYGLASREMSLVAVVRRAGDRPGELPETRVVPVGMPQDVTFQGYFGGAQAAPTLMFAAAPAPRAAGRLASMLQQGMQFCLSWEKPSASPRPRGSMLDSIGAESATPAADKETDALLDLALQLEPDGGMPGNTPSERAASSLAAVLAFAAEGHTATSGAFRSHVARLVAFLESLAGIDEHERELIQRALAAAAAGTVPDEDWTALMKPARGVWARVERM